jgi:predicted dehydrogenase
VTLRIAIVGFSQHVRQKVVPGIEKANGLKLVAFVTTSREKAAQITREWYLPAYSTIQEIPAGEVDVVYVATPIGDHATSILLALESGFHVICEKIICQTTDELDTCLRLAQEANRRLLEVRMYQYHAQFQDLVRIIRSERWGGQSLGKLTRLQCEFSIPELEASDFRYDKLRGGGAVFDVGFYPISVIITLFNDLKGIKGELCVSALLGVDVGGRVLARSRSATLQAIWSIGSTYKSEIAATFEFGSLVLERAFTKPSELAAVTQISVDGHDPRKHYPATDHFASMFSAYAHIIECGGWSSDYEDHLNGMRRTVDLVDSLVSGRIEVVRSLV